MTDGRAYTLDEYMYYPRDKAGMGGWTVRELPPTYPSKGVSILSVEATSPDGRKAKWDWRFETNPLKNKINHLGLVESWGDVVLVSIKHRRIPKRGVL